MSMLPDYLKQLIHKKAGRTEQIPLETWSGSISKKTLLKECPFVVFDTELSGLNVKKDFIVSIGAIKMTGGIIHISKEFYRLVRPAGEMSRENVEIHGITPGELKDKEHLSFVLPELLEYIQDSVLVGHFAHIDVQFVGKALKDSYGAKLLNPAIDTHALHEWLYENSSDFRKHYGGAPTGTDLFTVAQRYGITVDTLHNALQDAFITAQLFQRFLPFLESAGIGTVEDALDIGHA